MFVDLFAKILHQNLKCQIVFSEKYILPNYSVYMGGSEQTCLYSYNAESRVNIRPFFLDMSGGDF